MGYYERDRSWKSDGQERSDWQMEGRGLESTQDQEENVLDQNWLGCKKTRGMPDLEWSCQVDHAGREIAAGIVGVI